MIDVVSVKKYVILKFSDITITRRLERRHGANGVWEVFTATGFVPDGASVPSELSAPAFLDDDVSDGIYQYRVRDYLNADAPYEYTSWVRCGNTVSTGYTFGNYTAPEGQWGDVLTSDDMRYTYLWGIDFRASNGQSYTDDQIKFHIESSLAEMERRLNITIKKKRIACNAQERGLKQNIDYDEEESYYTFRREKIQRSGMIHTRKRPVQKVTRLDLFSRNNKVKSLLDAYTLDKNKGKIQFFNRPLKMDDSMRAVQTAVYPYGAETFQSQLFYAIDYVAGYDSSDSVPKDLRAAIGKMCAIEMLNIIGDGILAGFSSSSLSMDGVSESFSSTQSATSATYGARIKAYTEELDDYIKSNKLKFSNMILGAL